MFHPTQRPTADPQSALAARAAHVAAQLEAIGQAVALALTLGECLHLVAAQAGEAEPPCVLDARRLLSVSPA